MSQIAPLAQPGSLDDLAQGLAPEARRSALLLVSTLGSGGAERQLVYLAAGLSKRGWRVRIGNMTSLIDPTFAHVLHKAGVEVTVLQPGTERSIVALFSAVGRAIQIVRALRPHVIVGFMPHGALLGRLLGIASHSSRVVSSLRNSRATHRWHDWLLALTSSLDDAVVFNSQTAAAAQLQARVTTARKSVVIANGFDADRIPEPRGQRAVHEREFVWLSVAVFRYEKDHRTLLEAFQRLARIRRVRLVLVGSGPLLEPMKRLARELDIDANVEFAGFSSQVSAFIRNADAFVLASKWEGLPNVLIEAQAGGLPAVATDVGGCCEVVCDEVSGLLVPPENPESLAAAMARMMDLSDAERQKMSAAGRAHAIRHFSMENMISRWEQVLS